MKYVSIPSLVLEEAHHCAADTNSHYYSGNNHSRYATYIHTNSITHVAILMSMNHILKKSDTFTEDFGRLGRRSSEQINIVRDALNCRIPNKWKTDTNI